MLSLLNCHLNQILCLLNEISFVIFLVCHFMILVCLAILYCVCLYLCPYLRALFLGSKITFCSDAQMTLIFDSESRTDKPLKVFCLEEILKNCSFQEDVFNLKNHKWSIWRHREPFYKKHYLDLSNV